MPIPRRQWYQRFPTIEPRTAEVEPASETDLTGTRPEREESVALPFRAGRPRSPPSHLPMFDEEQSFDFYMVQFRDAARYYHWTEEEKIYYLKTRLKGAASHLVYAQRPRTFQALVDVLRASYGTKALIDRYRNIIRTCRRGERETLQELHTDILRMMVSAYPEASDSMVSDFGMDAFIRALDPDLRRKIRDRAPEGLDDALCMALEHEVHEGSPSDDRFESTKKSGKSSLGKERSGVHAAIVKDAPVDPSLGVMKTAFEELEERCRVLSRDCQALHQENLRLQKNDLDNSARRSDRGRGGGSQPASRFRRRGFPRRAPYDQGRFRSRVQCWNCGEVGHVCARCPHPPKSSDSSRQTADRKTDEPTRSFVKSADAEVFVQVLIGRKHRRALLDTGCSRTLLPLKMLPKSTEIRPIVAESVAANATKIDIRGEADLKFQLGSQTFELKVWVSEQVEEFLLGHDWLSSVDCWWYFRQHKFVVNGEEVPLYSTSNLLSS